MYIDISINMKSGNGRSLRLMQHRLIRVFTGFLAARA